MDKLLTELYYQEVESARLDFDADPDYAQAMARTLQVLPARELPQELLSLVDVSNRLSFLHGFRLALALKEWAGGLLPPNSCPVQR